MCSKIINSLVSYNNTKTIKLHNFLLFHLQNCTARLSTFHFLDFWCAINGCIYLHKNVIQSIDCIHKRTLLLALQVNFEEIAAFRFHRNQWKKLMLLIITSFSLIFIYDERMSSENLSFSKSLRMRWNLKSAYKWVINWVMV